MIARNSQARPQFTGAAPCRAVEPVEAETVLGAKFNDGDLALVIGPAAAGGSTATVNDGFLQGRALGRGNEIVFASLSAGPLILCLFLVCLFSLYGERKKATELSRASQNIRAILAGIITVAVWIAALEFIKTIPILGEQVTFLLRDYDD